MYFVYILYSSKTDKFYTGSTDRLEARLKHHNSGSTPSTKSGAPHWVLKYSESLPDRKSALRRELEIKKKKSRIYIEWLISENNIDLFS
ncbi:GIY-YIG nuclease family protein [Algoriphagus sp. D3-2-R+10]|uniref:GIY-YIG nuclease family protein n=1 Tax=Algoriphagus aurantiacus TaxID=3103948 RepID=UPI002B369112|nr:GIY-YIG nuclease family protein [Algoriphagus sp. D3-2-R+10]MEB2775744.1 GIY-YIG nuclease family protein [Algoriphagus sp. D3-2-R+10]MEB2775745.1 GIY-YIG nuclease family protein [Algoriphagus sp. D3-2-R+10]